MIEYYRLEKVRRPSPGVCSATILGCSLCGAGITDGGGPGRSILCTTDCGDKIVGGAFDRGEYICEIKPWPEPQPDMKLEDAARLVAQHLGCGYGTRDTHRGSRAWLFDKITTTEGRGCLSIRIDNAKVVALAKLIKAATPCA